jgi:daunorubicin resistance ABC transporter ATP-binding subunit
MSDHIVAVEGIHKTFGDDIHALIDVSLEFEPGIIYGLLGPNGAGKTTLIRVLATLLRPDRGKATVAGIDVLSDPVTARTRLGLAGQFAAVDDYLTGRENVEMVGRLYNLSAAEAKKRADEVLEQIHLIDAADRQVKTYSGGMRRRLDLAASMVGRPEVLFLDEPTTGIDPRSRVDIWQLIEQLVDGGTTILLTTQYLEEADQLAARIGVIDRGRLIEEGTPDELKDTLGSSVVELTVADDHRPEVMQILDRINGDSPNFDAGSKRITLAAPDGSRTLVEVVRALDGVSITPNDLTLRRPTLDDVFMAITGHTAQETDQRPKRKGRGAQRERSSA